MIKRIIKMKKAAVLGAAVFVAALSLATSFGTQATFAGDCSANAIMNCGAANRADFISKVKANTSGDLQTIYNAYGLSTSDYSRFASSARNGYAYKDGRVVVDGRTVVTDSKSIGRHVKSYSKPVVIGGKTYHESRAQDIYLSSSLPVMVLFDSKGRVETIVMNDCGNPVRGNPVNPSYSCDHLNKYYVEKNTYDFSTNTTAVKGATIAKVVYDFGDGSATVTKTNPSEKVRHKYTKSGTHQAKVTVYVKVPFGDTQVLAPAGGCVREVVIAETKKPGVSVDKTAEGADGVFKDHVIVGAGNTFRYKVVVKNIGEVDLKNAVVTDKAPSGIDFIKASVGSVANDVWTYTVPSLKVGQSVTVYITAVAPKEFSGETKNTVCVDAVEVPGSKDDCDDAWVSTHHRAVSINKVVNGKEHATVEVGKPFVYTLAVKNEGDVALKNVAVSDPAPANVQFVSADKGSVAGNKWSYTIPELGVGQTMEFKITAKLTKYVEGTIKNTACVDAPIISGNPDDCDDATIDTPKPKAVVTCDGLMVQKLGRTEFRFTTEYTVENATLKRVLYEIKDASGVTVAAFSDADGVATFNRDRAGDYTVQATVYAMAGDKELTAGGAECKARFEVKELPKNPAVEIVKTVDGVESKQVALNTNFTYELVVTNKGNVALGNVVVTDTPQTGIVLVSAANGTIQNNTWTHTVPALAVGQSVKFALVAKVMQQTTQRLVNTACVNAPEVNPEEPTKNDDCDDAVVTVAPEQPKNPNISITKVVNDEESIEVSVGQTFTYKLVVKNNGEIDMKQVAVRDNAPQGVVLLGANLGTVNGTTWSYTIPELKVGESVEFTLSAKVESYVANSLVNTACVNAAEVNPDEATKDDACDTATVTLTPPETTPQVLPNTGAGSVIGLVGLVTVASAAAYRFVIGRRLAE